MDINSYLVPGKRVHLAGIGGVSMSPLAEVLHSMGLSVQGSDMNDSPAVEPVSYTHLDVYKRQLLVLLLCGRLCFLFVLHDRADHLLIRVELSGKLVHVPLHARCV